MPALGCHRRTQTVLPAALPSELATPFPCVLGHTEQWLLAFAGLPGIQVPKGAVRIKCRSTPTQTATPRPCDSAQQQGTETTLRF